MINVLYGVLWCLSNTCNCILSHGNVSLWHCTSWSTVFLMVNKLLCHPNYNPVTQPTFFGYLREVSRHSHHHFFHRSSSMMPWYFSWVIWFSVKYFTTGLWQNTYISSILKEMSRHNNHLFHRCSSSRYWFSGVIWFSRKYFSTRL